MIIQMVYQMSGGRYDDRTWPTPWTDFEVPDEEGRGLISCGAAMEVVGIVVSAAEAESVVTAAESAAETAALTAKAAESASETAALAAEAPAPAAPRPADPKQDWVDYAVSLGAPRSEAETQTKVQLMAAFGGRL